MALRHIYFGLGTLCSRTNHIACILEHHDALELCRIPFFAKLRIANKRFCIVGIYIRILEESAAEDIDQQSFSR